MSTQTARKPGPTASMNETLEGRIDDTRRLVRQVDLSLSILTLLSIVLGILLVAILADHWLFADGLSARLRMTVFAGLLGVTAFYVYRRIVPLFLYPINPVYAASILEASAPSLKNSIVNWILLRRERAEREGSMDKLTERMFDGVTRTAASNVVELPTDRAVDLRGLARWGIVLTLLLLCFIGYGFFSPKSPMTSLARLMLPLSGIRTPQAVRFHDVQPGDTTVLQGERLTISAELLGRTAGLEPVYLFFSTDDGQAVRQAVPMTLPAGQTRFEAPFPPGKQGFVSGVDYWLQQGESRSDKYRIDVRPIASIEVASLTYKFPDYTGLGEEIVETGGDIRGVEGTEVRLAVRSTLPLQRVDMILDNDPAKTTALKITGPSEALAVLTLRHDPESTTPTTVHHYSFRAVDADGFESRKSGVFRMEILPDRAPTVQWSSTAEALNADRITVPLNGRLDLPIEAEDPDFGIRYLRLNVESGNKRIRPVDLLESPATGPTKHTGPIRTATVFTPIKSRLAEGDTAEIWVEAVDTKFPEPNVATTRKITVLVGEPQKQEDPKQKEDKEKQDGKKDEEKDQDKEKAEQENAKKTSDEKGDETGDDSGDSKSEKSTEAEDGKDSEDGGMKDPEDGGKEKGETGKTAPDDGKDDADEKQESNETANDMGDEDSEGGQGDKKPGETGKEQPGDSNDSSDPDKDGDGSKNEPGKDGQQDGDKKSEESGQKNDKNGKKQEKIDPDSQDGDAMEKILEQMKKENKLPKDGDQKDDGADKNSDKNQDQAKPDQPKDKSKDGQPEQKNQQQDQQQNADQPKDQQQKKDQKKDCPNKDCPGECSSCNGGGDKKDGQKDGQSGDGKEGEQGAGDKPGGSSKDQGDSDKEDSKDGGEQGGAGSKTGTQETEKQGNQAGKPDGGSPDDSKDGGKDGAKQDGQPGDGEQQQGGGEKSPEKKNGEEQGSGGGESGDKNSAPSQQKGDNRNDDGQEVPVDPNDKAPHERDRSLDPNSKQRKNQGGDSSDPKKSDETAKDVPENTTTSGDTGKGQESRQQGSSEKTQSAEDGDMKGEKGESGAEQEGGSKGTGEMQESDGDDGGESGESGGSQPGQEGQESSQQSSQGDSSGKEGKQGDQSGQPGQGGQNESGDGEKAGTTTGPGGGGTGGESVQTPKEETNLEYTEKVTNLVLEYLEDQLKDAPNKELLDNLGWTEEDLRRFHDRWKEMSEKGQKPEADPGSDEVWKEALKSLGLRPSRERPEQRRSHSEFKDDGTASEALRYAPPKSLQQRFRRYNEGVAGDEKK